MMLHNRTIKFLVLILSLSILVSCSTQPTQSPGAVSPEEPLAAETSTPLLLPTKTLASEMTVSVAEATIILPSTATPQDQPTREIEQNIPTHTPLALDAWEELPVVPRVSQRTIDIYQAGLQMDRDPHRFSKIGDCQNVSSYFLSPFEFSSAYRLGKYQSLQEAIDWFHGSFIRDSLAVKGGFNVAAVLSPLRADPKQCEQGESPAACELRVHNPSFAIISMETWWSGKPENYEKYMRQLLDYLISQGVVPILATKADNLEGEHQINRTLGQLAWEYDIPLWNFWASVQDLPDKGLTEDGFHLTLGDYFYDDPQTTQTGWSMRNLTALQAIDAVWRGVTKPAASQP
jgi:hypothetical protein